MLRCAAKNVVSVFEAEAAFVGALAHRRGQLLPYFGVRGNDPWSSATRGVEAAEASGEEWAGLLGTGGEKREKTKGPKLEYRKLQGKGSEVGRL